MKLNFKRNVMVIAFSLLLTGVAIANQVLGSAAVNETVYTWNKVGSEEPPFIGTKAQAQDHFGCRGTVDACAIGTPNNPALPQEVIYQN